MGEEAVVVVAVVVVVGGKDWLQTFPAEEEEDKTR